MADAFDLLGRFSASCLRMLPPETAHDIGMKALELGALNWLPEPQFHNHGVQLMTELPGVGRLAHPIGLAAGFDKNARCPTAFQRMGFSFIEVGTVTPKPQDGNPKPRLFRDSGQRSITNRMGFNGEGIISVVNRVKGHNWSGFHPPMGVNLGKNKLTPNEDALKDFEQGLRAFEQLASYFVINISSPNTPGLRELANPEFIESLGAICTDCLKRVWIKLDPDMSKKEFQSMIRAIMKVGFAGVILSNTHRVVYPQVGGQSGHPLLSLSNAVLEWAWDVHQGLLPMIGCGGILSGVDAYHKIARGASAVQLYTALVYRGPGAVAKIMEELAIELKLRGFGSVGEAVGSWYKE